MKKYRTIWILCLLLCFAAVSAGAEGSLSLPGGHVLPLPNGVTSFSTAVEDPETLLAYCLGDQLELQVYYYETGDCTLQELAQSMTDNGLSAQLRSVQGEVMLVYDSMDEADGALCIGYVYEVSGHFTEIVFWYGSDEAARMTEEMMNGFY